MTLTPYDDNYPTCDRCVAELRLYDNNLEPERISQLLGLEPSSARRRGETATNSLGRTRTARVGHWILSSEGHVLSKDLRRHLDWLLAQITPRAGELRLLREEGTTMSVTCIWWAAHGGGPVLWPTHLAALAALDVELSFDLAFYDEE